LALSKSQVRRIFERLQAANPEPKTELHYSTPFELLVAVILSAQATDVGVNKATARLFSVANTPQAMLALGEEGLKPYIATIGLFNSKAKNIIRMCAMLIEHHGGEVPQSREALEHLPGVGRKTANVVLNVVFGDETIAVDTHIFRVANRTGLAPGRTPLEVEKGLMQIIPKPFRRHAHHWLVLHGRYICTARRPKCADCPIAGECQWPEKMSFA
jgi:endonuclease III